MTQGVTKNRTDFPVPELLITNKTEAIMKGMMQDKNRELPFYPDPISIGHQNIYDHIAHKVRQTLDPK